jgi:hypothetical protein
MTEPDATTESSLGAEEFVTIYLDRAAYRVPRRPMSGQELRNLPTPGLSSDLDLFQVSAGSSDDLVVHDEELVHINEGEEFFTAPRTILAG